MRDVQVVPNNLSLTMLQIIKIKIPKQRQDYIPYDNISVWRKVSNLHFEDITNSIIFL